MHPETRKLLQRRKDTANNMIQGLIREKEKIESELSRVNTEIRREKQLAEILQNDLNERG